MTRRILGTTVAIALSGAVAVSVALAPNASGAPDAAVPTPKGSAAVAAVAAASAPTTRSATRKGRKGQEVPKVLFGMNASGQNTGAKALRLWDVGVTWRQLEPTQGVINWAPLDEIVNRARANGYKNILYVFGSTPAWAAGPPSAGEAYGPGSASFPKKQSYYLDYVRQVVQRYKGRINSYQIWNEADLSEFYSGSPEALAKLTAKTYRLIKSIDRRAKVAAAGLVPRPSRFGSGSFEYRYLNTLRRKHWPTDAFIISMYPENQNPKLRLTYSNIVRKTLQKLKAPSKQLWESEANYFSSDQQPFSEATQMRLVARTYIDSMTYGFARVYWYSWTQQWPQIGIRMTTPAGSPTPAATAYSTVASWMSGKRWKGCKKKAGVMRCAMTGGQRATIMFANSSPRNVAAPKGTTAVCDLYNRCTALQAGARFAVTSSPLLVQGARR